MDNGYSRDIQLFRCFLVVLEFPCHPEGTVNVSDTQNEETMVDCLLMEHVPDI